MNKPKSLIFKLTIALNLLITSHQSLAISELQGARPNSFYENRTCEQLYLAAGRLENKALNYESEVFNDGNNAIASIVSTVFTPALYFLGYSNLMSFKSERESYQSNEELNKIRLRMAEMRCFQR